jgi:DNA modification methylase
MTYAQRYIAFVDIVGFRELIRKSERDPELIETIRSTINEVHKAEPGDGYVIAGDDMRSESISDAVAISTAENCNGLYKILHSVQMMQWRLLERGILIRACLRTLVVSDVFAGTGETG